MPEDKFSGASAAAERVARAKSTASTSAVLSIRTMLEALRLALDGRKLVGLPNVATSRSTYRAIRVLPGHADKKLPRLGPGEERTAPTPCLNSNGHLVWAVRRSNYTTEETPIEDSEMLSEWPEAVADTILAALDFHLVGCAKSEARYMKLDKLSKRLTAALEE